MWIYEDVDIGLSIVKELKIKVFEVCFNLMRKAHSWNKKKLHTSSIYMLSLPK